VVPPRCTYGRIHFVNYQVRFELCSLANEKFLKNNSQPSFHARVRSRLEGYIEYGVMLTGRGHCLARRSRVADCLGLPLGCDACKMRRTCKILVEVSSGKLKQPGFER
jgi:hypothetical protein